jgi:biotin carboxyl carrier protein
MRKFNIKVNGRSYEVEVEELIGTAAEGASEPVQSASKKEEPVQNNAPQPAASPSANATNVSAPMPGNIVSINVSVGDSVNEGDILLILEAMKMENEILSPKSGTITAIQTAVGTNVNTGDILVSIS